MCHPCASLEMRKREEATRWLMLPYEHVSLTARSDLRELHRGALPQTRAVKEGCEASAGTHVGWEAQHPTARKAVAEPTEQSKRLGMIFRVCSPACLAAGCEETSLPEPFRIEASSCYMKHLKWRARWECRLNPLSPKTASSPHPTPPSKIAHWRS